MSIQIQSLPTADMVQGRWTAERTQLASRPARDPFPITVHFAPSSWQGLHIRVAEHADGNYRIHPGCSAFEAEILKWAESDLGNASSGNFQRSLEAFLCLYSRRNCVEKVGSQCHVDVDHVFETIR